MKVRWSDRARQDLSEIGRYIGTAQKEHGSGFPDFDSGQSKPRRYRERGESYRSSEDSTSGKFFWVTIGSCIR